MSPSLRSEKRTKRVTTTLLVEFAYDGHRFHGLQPQPNRLTCGATLRSALEQHFAAETRALSFSARTDAGVSAIQNFATLRLETDSQLPERVAKINAGALEHLAQLGLFIIGAHIVPRSLNARNSALSKTYRYRIKDARRPSPTNIAWNLSCWEMAPRLDVALMRSAADVLVGTHDFGSFRAIRCAAKSTRRELTQVDVVRNGEELLLTVSGNAFLRKMVRIICGTLAEVGAGLRPVAHLELALRTQHREFAGITAPAHGLTLECVKLCASAEQVRSTARSAAL